MSNIIVPRGCLVLDPHGDMAEEIVCTLPESCLDRVYYIEPALLADYPLAFNPLAGVPGMKPDDIRNTVIAGLSAAWEIDPAMASFLLYSQRTLSVLVQLPGAHFGYILPFLTNQDFRDHVLDIVGDQEAIHFWRGTFNTKTRRNQEEDTRSFLSRVNQFLIDSSARDIFCQSKTKVDFVKLMDEGKIVIAHFGDANLGPINKKLLGNLFCGYVHQACRKRSAERRPFLVLIDEAGEFLTRTLAEVLAQDRKFGVSFSPSFQYCEQVEAILPAIIGNVQTWIAFRLGESDARRLAPIFSDSSENEEVLRREDDLMNQERYRAFLKTSVDGKPQPTTTFRLFAPEDQFRPENINIALENTRRDLCRPRKEVEEEQAKFLKMWGGSIEDEGGASSVLSSPVMQGHSNIALTDRDLDILVLLSRIRYMTLTQISLLFYGHNDGYHLNLEKARDSLKHRVAQLVRADYLGKGVTRYGDKLNIRAYFLGPQGARALKELALLEQMETPGWLSRKQNAVWSCGAHDLKVNNFLINLLLLSKLRGDFIVDDWASTYDGKRFIRGGDNPLIFDPDLYVSFTNSGYGPVPFFLELDNGHISMNIARRKAKRVFQYYESGRWRRELGAEFFPRVAVIVPDQQRIVFFKRAISWAKKAYQGRARLQVQKLTFYLATFEQVDLFSLDRGAIADKPLSPCWQTSEGRKSVSPFLK